MWIKGGSGPTGPALGHHISSSGHSILKETLLNGGSPKDSYWAGGDVVRRTRWKEGMAQIQSSFS